MIPDFHNERWICICAALRACEQRVREDMALQYLVSDREQQEQEERAFAAGVQAARDAVAAVSVGGQHFWAVGFRDGTEQALAAIDALRGSGNPDTPPSAEKGEKP